MDDRVAMKRYLLHVLLFIGLLAGLAATVQAQEPITIERSDAGYTFQKEVRFSLQASGNITITQATLHFRLADQPASNLADAAITPHRSIKAEYAWRLVDEELPSGTVVTYWWTVEDAAGNKIDSERRSFTYEDTRFTWKKLSRDDVTLAWYRGDDAFGRDLLDAATSAAQRLMQEFSVERKPAAIYVYGNYNDLRSGIGESAQEWTGGRAYPEFGVVLIGVPTNQLAFGRRAVAHEFAHLIVHRATSNPFGDLPRWLDEGLAMWTEGDLDSTYKAALNRAVRSNRLLSLQTLASNFPADAQQATLAYAESYSAVVYIRDQFGAQKVGDLLTTFKEGTTDDTALQKVLGLTTDELDARWRASLGVGADSSSQEPDLTDSFAPRRMLLVIGMGLLAGAAVVFVALVAVVIRIRA